MKWVFICVGTIILIQCNYKKLSSHMYIQYFQCTDHISLRHTIFPWDIYPSHISFVYPKFPWYIPFFPNLSHISYTHPIFPLYIPYFLDTSHISLRHPILPIYPIFPSGKLTYTSPSWIHPEFQDGKYEMRSLSNLIFS